MILETLAGIALAGYSTAKALEIHKQVSEIGLIVSVKRVKNAITDAIGDCRSVASGVQWVAQQRRIEKARREAVEAERRELSEHQRSDHTASQEEGKHA